MWILALLARWRVVGVEVTVAARTRQLSLARDARCAAKRDRSG